MSPSSKKRRGRSGGNKPQPKRPGDGPASRAEERATLLDLLTGAQDLLDKSRPAEALALLEPNLSRFGKYALFRAMLASVYSELDRHREAVVQARLAIEMEPQTPDFQMVAAMAYSEAGYLTLAYRARRKWLRAAPAHHPAASGVRQLDELYQRWAEHLRDQYRLADTQLAEEAGYWLDEGRWAIDQRQWETALRASRQAIKLAPNWPPPHNNVSTTLFYMGHVAEAIAEAELVLRELEPDNLHALANLVRYHIAAGNVDAADSYADRLSRLPVPADREKCIKIVEGLSLAERDQDVDRTIKSIARKLGGLPPSLRFTWGVARANLGRRREALAEIRSAIKAGETSPLVKETLQALEAGKPGRGVADRFSYTDYLAWIDKGVLDEIAELAKRDARHGAPGSDAWAELLQRRPQLLLAMRKLLYESEEATDVAYALQVLGKLRTPAAVEIVRGFAQGQKGDQAIRMKAVHTLEEMGALSQGGEIEMWVGGERRLIRSFEYEISPTVISAYPPAVTALFEEALATQKAGRLAEAERTYERILKLAPKAKEAYNNLAVIYEKRGDSERASACVDKALAIDPLYVFARVPRAMKALQDHDIAAAREWLAPLAAVRKWHPAGFAEYQKAMARVAMAEEHYEQALLHLDLIQEMADEDPDISALRQRIEMMQSLNTLADRFHERFEKFRLRRRNVALPADPTLAECLGSVSKGDLTGMRAVLRLHRISTLRKTELSEYLAGRFSDPEFVAGVVRNLEEREQAALKDILSRGGVMDRQVFVDAYGDEGEEGPSLEFGAATRKTVMGRLRARGLLFEGTTDGRLVVAIPRELRPLLQDALG